MNEIKALISMLWPITDRITVRVKNLMPKGTMSFQQFVSTASDNGWKIEPNSLDVLDLVHGVRQAAYEGHIKLWGRRYPGYSMLDAHDTRVYEQIPAKHFKQYDIYVPFEPMSQSTWYQTHSVNGNEYYDRLYINRRDAFNWLRSREARSWMGRRDQYEKTGQMKEVTLHG